MGMKNLYCLKRSGLLAVKKGMMTLFDDCNRAIPSTVLQVDNCYALGTRKIPGFDTAVFQDVGMGPKQPKNISYPLLRYFKTCGVPPLGNVRSFKISPTAIIPQGTRLYAGHFLVGQYVDVQGISKGKGFQGVMKRWGFKGGPASHGSSKFHRRPGSIGAGTNSRGVHKGKKMPGRMGGKHATAMKLKVLKIDNSLNLLYVKGSVPGPNSSTVLVKDSAFCHNYFEALNPPMPTFYPTADIPREIEDLSSAKPARVGPPKKIFIK